MICISFLVAQTPRPDTVVFLDAMQKCSIWWDLIFVAILPKTPFLGESSKMCGCEIGPLPSALRACGGFTSLEVKGEVG